MHALHRALQRVTLGGHATRVAHVIAAAAPRTVRATATHRTMSTAPAAASSEAMQIDTPTAAPAAAASLPATSAPGDASAGVDTEMETVYSCTIGGLSGWEPASKVERRLLDHKIPFKSVQKRKGVREDTGTIFFESEQQMTDSMAIMQELREAPTVRPTPVKAVNVAPPTEPTAVDAAAPGAEPVAVAAATPAPLLTRQLFKVRTPVVVSRKRVTRPESPRIDKNTVRREFRSAKRTKVELVEGDVGYAQAAEEARSASEAEGEEPVPSGRVSPTHLVERTINDVVAPLWRKSYAEQLVIKRTEVKELMQQTTKNWTREYGKALAFPHQAMETKANGRPAPLFCTLEEIVPSPVTEAYRNKCEFSIGFDSNEKPSIGHLMGKYTEGTVTVESIQDCPHVPGIAKSLSATLLEFMNAHAADYKPYDKRDHSGFWRLVICRNSLETKQAMILVQVSSKGKTPEEMTEFRARLVAHFKAHITENAEWRAANEQYDLKAIQLQLYDGVSNAAPEGTPVELLFGTEGCITERLMGLDFRVSQAAFFQINCAVPTEAQRATQLALYNTTAERERTVQFTGSQTDTLYTLAADCAALPSKDAPQSAKDKTTLLDVCCGTGTIGLSLANRVGKIVGLEMSASAVEDAKHNAKANGIINAYYYVGKAEDTLSAALAEHVNTINTVAQADHVVTAIVDPPRSGLHADVVRLLRRCPRIDRIVYVSCNPKSLMENLQRFVQPPSKRWVGAPFTAVKAFPVDMFPQTPHCEMVVLLERPRQPLFQQQQKKQLPPTKVFAHQLAPPAAAAALPVAAAAAAATPATDAAAVATPAAVEAVESVAKTE